jgi:phosphohistidine phosphatase
MELLLLRHGKAEPHGHPQGDAARALVTKGHAQAKRAANLLKTADRLPHIVLTSPLDRARQTAETFCSTAGLAPPLVQDWLASGMHPETAIRELAAFGDFGRVCIVGHEPDFSELAGQLLGGGRIEIKKGAVACFELNPSARRATLTFLVPPGLTLGMDG